MPKFYRKSLPATPLRLSGGQTFRFQEYPADGRGYLKTDNEYLIKEFSSFIAKKIGGVAEITEEEYTEALKKNESLIPPKPVSERNKPPVLIPPPETPAQARKRAAESAAAKAASGSDTLPLPVPFQNAIPVGFVPNVDKLLANTKRK